MMEPQQMTADIQQGDLDDYIFAQMEYHISER